jgi:hypothetical protein
MSRRWFVCLPLLVAIASFVVPLATASAAGQDGPPVHCARDVREVTGLPAALAVSLPRLLVTAGSPVPPDRCVAFRCTGQVSKFGIAGIAGVDSSTRSV